MSARLRLAIVASASYPLFQPAVKSPIGGMETQAWRFARGIAERGDAEIAVIVGDYRQPMLERIGGVDLWNYSRIAWFMPPFLREQRALASLAGWLHWARQVSLQGRIARWGRPALAAIPADVMSPYGVNHLTADVIRTCRRRGRCSMFLLASDSDLDPVFLTSKGRRHDGERAEYGHIAIHESNLIVAQTEDQKQVCESRFGRKAVVVFNPFELPLEEQALYPVEDPHRETILWVGRAETFHKRPLLLLELARKLPSQKFQMVLNPRDPLVESEVRHLCPPNVSIVQNIPHAEMKNLFAKARVFVSTSTREMEGFPNVFLEAGHYGVPVASLESDPDGIFQRDDCGISCNRDLERLSRGIEHLATDRTLAARYVTNMRSRIASKHSLSATCQAFIDAARLALTLPPGNQVCPAEARRSQP